MNQTNARRRCLISVGALLLLSSSTSYADLSQEILDGITSGQRVIRPEITSLKTVPAPEPSNLNDFVQNKAKAIQLGKALFWDMQMSSDGVQACGSCHFNAGADSRAKNQLSPGLRRALQDGSPDPDNTFTAGTGPNYHLKVSEYPRHLKQDLLRFDSTVLRDSDDVVSSQGVHYAETSGAPPFVDPDGFRVGGINTRRVEPRNTPTVINAVFNHRQFWDGRASNIFNGVNSFGTSDPFAYVYKKVQGALTPVTVAIDNASLASQAVAPPVSNLEMSADGQTWSMIGDSLIERPSELPRQKGKRVLMIRPLANQLVHPQDSVLGPLSRGAQPGLTVPSYQVLIQQAFKPEWWNSQDHVRIEADGSRTIVSQPGPDTYSQMEMNFSLFFGLAVQLYEATLVSDDSPVDRYLEGNTSALSQSALIGFHIADVEGRCLNCHGRGEFTFAAVSRIQERGLTRIREGDLIDEGFNNIGVRPTLEDLGVGGVDPFGNPLGFARKTHLGLYDNPLIPGILDEQAADLADDGSFKIPTLRNVELTAPYFHNGGELTLEDVIDFYFRGGNFRTFDPADAHPIIGFDSTRTSTSPISGLGVLAGPLLNSGPGLDAVDKANLVAFLKALTDERVRYRQAPFDHPQLFITDGHPGTHLSVTDDGDGSATDALIELPAVGASGAAPLPTFMDSLLP